MIQSIYAGVSGLQSFQTGIDVLANNIANVNTVGFKGSTAEFSNLFSQAVNTSGNAVTSMQTGLGVQVNASNLDLSEGSYYQSGNTTDLAIVGDDGWFGLTGPNEEEFFSRAGNFRFDPYSADGIQTDLRLINPEGYLLTGTLADNTNGGVLSPVVESLELADVNSQEALSFPSELAFPLQPTTQADFIGNIGVENLPKVVSATVISPQGERNSLRLAFTQAATQPATGIRWDVTATTQTADGLTVYDTQTGVVDFDGGGSLISSTLGTIDNNGAPVTANLGTGLNGIISNSGPTLTTSGTADGILAGDLVDYSVNRNGEVISNFTNGKQSIVGKVAIYHFQNDQGLEAISGNRFRASDNSGEPIFYAQENGSLLSGTLENSNVTLETALTELIIMQRSYDATAKTISTSDQMLQNALQMGR